MNISVCIIVKNEQNNIEHCLKCLTPYMPEIIVVDTGSTDNTKAIASQYTDRVYDFSWINDFAVAKNFAISKEMFLSGMAPDRKIRSGSIGFFRKNCFIMKVVFMSR